MDSILYWNDIALELVKVDFTPGTEKLFPEFGGPTRTSRVLAIIHLAMYDAHAGLSGIVTYLPYSAAEQPGVVNPRAAQCAVSAAACMSMLELYTRQSKAILDAHAAFLASIGSSDPDLELGLAWGRLVAARMLAERHADGAREAVDVYAPSDAPGRHRVDPLNPNQGFLGSKWGNVAPFGIVDLTSKIATVRPPDLIDARYGRDYVEVIEKGRADGGTRTRHETTVGLFWAYDGASGIGVPPRLYNQVAYAAAVYRNNSEAKNARLFAMLNVAMADAGILAWHEKYLYNVWRPVVGIREADAGWGPSRGNGGDGNAATIGDPYWVPLGAPRTNEPDKASFTPNFPAYPSGHATFGTAALRIVEQELELTDEDRFVVVSDELDGKAIGKQGVRPRYENSVNISTAIQENQESRIFLGVHWRFDAEEGNRIGEEIARLIAVHFPQRA